MLRHKRGSQEWLEFEIFQEFKDIEHAVFLRGSEPASEEGFAKPYQVHGKIVLEAVEGAGKPCDGLVTDKAGVQLLIRHADCQAAIFYDPVKKVIANVHAGWRGQGLNIYQEVIDQMRHKYGSKPENLFVGISPSLGPCCAQFIHYEKELPAHFWEYQERPLYFDLWAIAQWQLTQAGIVPSHIQVAEVCTCCNPSDYFSYRRDRVPGRNQATMVKKLIRVSC